MGSSDKGGWIFAGPFLTLALIGWLHRYGLLPGHQIWPLTLGLALSGLFSVSLGLHARFSPPRLILERETGREFMRRPVPSFFWIRAEYWCVLFLGLAILLQWIGPARSAQ